MVSEITNEHGQTFIGGLNRVFHCNYYNAYLQYCYRKVPATVSRAAC